MRDNSQLAAEFVERITEHQGVIHKICYVYDYGRDRREDLKQEIILQLWKSSPGFQGKSKFSTWMYRIAFNTAITNMRKSSRHPIVETLSGLEESFPAREDIAYLNDDMNALLGAIAELKDVEKAIVTLYMEEKSYREIGEIVGISEKNVSVRLVRLKAKLKRLVERE